MGHLAKIVKFMSASKFDRAATLLTCMQETPGWNMGRNANYAEFFLGLL
jgi:hypothetical protein